MQIYPVTHYHFIFCFEQPFLLNFVQLPHVARLRFYAINDLENQKAEWANDNDSSSLARNANKEHMTCHHRDRQQRLEAKNGVQFHNNIDGVVATYPIDKPVVTETLEDMRRLLTTIRRRVSVQYSGNSGN